MQCLAPRCHVLLQVNQVLVLLAAGNKAKSAEYVCITFCKHVCGRVLIEHSLSFPLSPRHTPLLFCFRTFDDVELLPTPQLNVIVGPNGTLYMQYHYISVAVFNIGVNVIDILYRDRKVQYCMCHLYWTRRSPHFAGES